MATKSQHYVPRVYLKEWETKVETSKEPQKQFDGVYYFGKEASCGEGSTRDSILWKPHLYTISFRQLYLATKCPKVYNFFAEEIYQSMINNSPQPVYGKLNYSVIKTQKSVHKHLLDIDNWDFYYYDGTTARKKSLLNRFNDMRCYILEDSFNSIFESKWEDILHSFIYEIKNTVPVFGASCERKISEKVAKDMMEFFFMMLCRSPQFDAMGIYSCMSDILKQSFGGIKEVDEMMDAVWFTELYRMFYKANGGFYHTALSKAVDICQFILFETYPDAGTFITSDNPAFQHISHVEATNMNGYYFPIDPNHLLMITKGSAAVNIVDYRMANSNLIKKFNQVIASHSKELIISKEKDRSKIL